MFMSGMKPFAAAAVAERSEVLRAVSSLFNALPLCVCQKSVCQEEETRGEVFMQPCRLSGAGEP